MARQMDKHPQRRALGSSAAAWSGALLAVAACSNGADSTGPGGGASFLSGGAAFAPTDGGTWGFDGAGDGATPLADGAAGDGLLGAGAPTPSDSAADVAMSTDGAKVDSKPPVATGPGSDKDKDGDGVTPAQGDCDDSDPQAKPGLLDTCNGKDDDCNGETDDFDKDKDTFSPCPGPKQDCNDTDPKIFPGAKPNCSNLKDNDCSGGIDAQEDGDADGWLSCEDCNDKDAAINPDAKPICNNGKDNDCDGAIDGKGDADKDGDPACKDCDDKDPKVYFGAPELCNQKDDDCNGTVDDQDNDGDGWSGCAEDCDDKDLLVNPLAVRNCKNGKDNDCSGIIDAQEDGDKDGFKGCDDCNDYNKTVNKGALEVAGDNVDNDCNGQTDEPAGACDKPGLNSSDPNDYPKAIGMCSNVVSSTFPTLAAGSARAIKPSFGPNNIAPKAPNLVALACGVAAAMGEPGYVNPQPGTSFSNTMPYPAGVKCPNSGGPTDYTEWKVTLQAPANAHAFAFDFHFMSAEYPEWVGSQFNDKFLAVVDSQLFKGNASFDSKGNCISVNAAFFEACNTANCSLGDGPLKGTGYENGIGGGTGWLTTTVPITPGELFSIRFIVFDEGDHILDSVALIDNFRWQLKATKGGPSTVRPGG